MLDQFVSGVWRLFETNVGPARPRVRQSAPVMVECLETRQMLTAPMIAAPTTVNVSEGTSFAFSGANKISFTDAAGTEKFSFTVASGQLAFGSTTGLQVTGNGTGVVLVTGKATAINTALATLSYKPNAGLTGTDNLSMYVLNSTTKNSTNAAIAITVFSPNVKPVITVPASITVSQVPSFAFTGGNAISLSDGVGTENFSLVVHHGQLHLGSTTGITVSGNGSSTVLISGSAAAVNSALQTLSYSPDTGYSGSDSVSMYDLNTASNQSTGATISMNVNPKSAPTVSGPTSMSTMQDTLLTFADLNQISIADQSGTAEQVTLSVQHGILTVFGTAGVTIANEDTATLTLTGALAAINYALARLQYTPASAYLGPDTLTLTVKDTTTNLTGNLSVSIAVTQFDVPPIIDAFSATHVTENSTVTLTGPAGTSIAISLSGGTADQLILSVGHGALNIATTAGVTIQNNNTSSLTLTGSAANISLALRTLQYTPITNYIGPDTLSLAAKDTATNLTSAASIAITVTPPITAPTITAPTTVTANHGKFSFSGSNTIHFYDNNSTGTETFSIAVQHGTLNISIPAVGLMSGNQTKTLLMQGTADQIFLALSSLTYIPDNGYSGPDSLTMYVFNSFTQQSTSAQIAITVAPTTVDPSIISADRLFVVVNQTAYSFGSFLNSAIVFSDGPGTVNFSLAVRHGRLTFYNSAGLTISGNGTSFVLLSGSAAAINAALGTLNYTPNTDYVGDDSFGMYAFNTTTNRSTSAMIDMEVHANF